ncbi:hypothetical protein FS749_009658 [Ceratobasidium sp. UAMH 11750]|nr:hypothetical protein FS749_009658 [Ceratobasidium sp. UAMH 11750]
MGGQDIFPGSFRHNSSWKELARITALQALQLAGEATTDDTSRQALYRVFASPTFDLDNSTPDRDSSFLVLMLWMECTSFLKLCTDGLLPGCSLLLLALWKLFPVAPEENFRRDCLFLQELSFRHFLVGSNRDRQILQLVSVYIIDRKIEWGGTNRSFDQEDSRRVLQAYSGLLYLSQRDIPSAKVLPVDLMSFIYKFVLFTLGPMDMAATLDLTSLSSTSIEFLWLLLEHRPHILATDQDKLRHYLLYIQNFTVKIEAASILTIEDKLTFGLALGDADFQNVVGRILLITALDGSELHDIELWEAFLDSISQVSMVIAYSSLFAPKRIPGAKADWAKVWEQIEVFWGLSLSDGRRAAEVQQCVADMRRAWDTVHVALDDETGVPRKCAYPRCFRPVATKRLLGARYACERCGTVTYCHRVCQRA